jgi:hypothetical protein
MSLSVNWMSSTVLFTMPLSPVLTYTHHPSYSPCLILIVIFLYLLCMLIRTQLSYPTVPFGNSLLCHEDLIIILHVWHEAFIHLLVHHCMWMVQTQSIKMSYQWQMLLEWIMRDDNNRRLPLNHVVSWVLGNRFATLNHSNDCSGSPHIQSLHLKVRTKACHSIGEEVPSRNKSRHQRLSLSGS